jgi:hypothetical protein
MPYQKDMHAGATNRAFIPDNIKVETTSDRIAQLTARAKSLPYESTARAIVIETLQRGYAVTLNL